MLQIPFNLACFFDRFHACKIKLFAVALHLYLVSLVRDAMIDPYFFHYSTNALGDALIDSSFDQLANALNNVLIEVWLKSFDNLTTKLK